MQVGNDRPASDVPVGEGGNPCLGPSAHAKSLGMEKGRRTACGNFARDVSRPLTGRQVHCVTDWCSATMGSHSPARQREKKGRGGQKAGMKTASEWSTA